MKRLSLILVVLIFCIINSYAQADPQAIVNQAAALREKNKCNEALEILNGSITSDSSYGRLYLERAKCFLITKDHEAFFRDIQKAVSLKAGRYEIIHALSGPPAENLPVIEALIKFDPTLSVAYERSAACKNVLGDYQGAIDDGLKAQELAGPLDITRSASVYAVQSLYKIKSDEVLLAQTDRILDFYRSLSDEIVNFTPQDERERVNQKYSLDHVQELRTTLTLSLAEFFETRGLSEEAQQLLEDMVRLEPRSFAYASRAKYFTRKGMLAKAKADEQNGKESLLKELTALLSEKYDVFGRENIILFKSNTLIRRGDCYLSLERFEEAIKDYETAKTVAPGTKDKADEKIRMVHQKMSDESKPKN